MLLVLINADELDGFALLATVSSHHHVVISKISKTITNIRVIVFSSFPA